jgi:hypothetical protein
VRITTDGSLVITDSRGIVRLRMGLPGRPLLMWRDAGTPLELSSGPFLFSSATPKVTRSEDFRWALHGLLWILDDGEQVITVLNPATLQVVYLPLPGGQDLRLVFYPDRLEAQETSGPSRRERAAWFLSWAAMLPHFIQLRNPAPGKGKLGTALIPFPGG